MIATTPHNSNLFCERRQFFRYGLRHPLAVLVEDPSRHEAVGLGQATEVSSGGLCVSKLSLPSQAKDGDEVDVMLLSRERELPLRGRLVRHDALHFGVQLDLSNDECDHLERLLVEASF